ncbi:MAG TPA: hypothetical protein VKN76_07610, partial [Kiloniellaceae bacterium]|nr:hypothetical protein [Kiloniellaceae bacterium]
RPEHLAFAALRDLRAAQAARPAEPLRLVAAPAVTAALTDGPAAAARAALEARLGRPLALESDAGEGTYQILRP